VLEFSKESSDKPKRGWLVADAPGLYLFLYAARGDERLKARIEKEMAWGFRTATTVHSCPRGYDVRHHGCSLRGKLSEGFLYEGLSSVTRIVLGAEGLDARLTLAAYSEHVARFEMGTSFPQTICISSYGVHSTSLPEGRVRGMRIIS
jgi:hypothetical protein